MPPHACLTSLPSASHASFTLRMPATRSYCRCHLVLCHFTPLLRYVRARLDSLHVPRSPHTAVTTVGYRFTLHYRTPHTRCLGSGTRTTHVAYTAQFWLRFTLPGFCRSFTRTVTRSPLYTHGSFTTCCTRFTLRLILVPSLRTRSDVHSHGFTTTVRLVTGRRYNSCTHHHTFGLDSDLLLPSYWLRSRLPHCVHRFLPYLTFTLRTDYRWVPYSTDGIAYASFSRWFSFHLRFQLHTASRSLHALPTVPDSVYHLRTAYRHTFRRTPPSTALPATSRSYGLPRLFTTSFHRHHRATAPLLRTPFATWILLYLRWFAHTCAHHRCCTRTLPFRAVLLRIQPHRTCLFVPFCCTFSPLPLPRSPRSHVAPLHGSHTTSVWICAFAASAFAHAFYARTWLPFFLPRFRRLHVHAHAVYTV